MSRLFIEAESFENKGGWVNETQSMEELHSAYLMAHGLGVPVKDATTTVTVNTDGVYAVWALTRDWTAVWGVKDSAGKFNIAVNGAALPAVLGTDGKEWAWQKAGEATLKKGVNSIALKDLTGFNGRVDALYLTDEGDIPSSFISDIDIMRKELNWKEIEQAEGEYDLLVAGGGIAGICVALSCARSGAKTILIHDREVLGGCNSSEVRVCLGGQINVGPYPKLGNVVKEIAPIMGNPRIFDGAYYEDDRKKFAFSLMKGSGMPYTSELVLNERVTDIEEQGSRISAVITTNTVTGKKKRYCFKNVADCTGDGIIARLAGCKTMYGREAKSEFNELLAPENHENLVMGHSLRWYSKENDREMPFPDIDWNLNLDDNTCFNVFDGDWEQETGFRRDMIHETEYIRDYGLRAIFSNWAYQKHHHKDKAKYANRSLVWVSPLGGKRESCRIVGEYVLTQNDIDERIIHPDASACMSWSIDMHFPEPDNEAAFEEPFKSYAYHRGIVEPYPVPYRCLVAKGVDNLFLGGRIVSCSHVAFSSIRVMRTLGALGEVAGLAAGICAKHNCTPLEVYTKYLNELVLAMEQGVVIPDAFACTCGVEEAYHFKDIGWLYLRDFQGRWYLCDSPDRMDKFMRGIEAIGVTHTNPYPPNMEFKETPEEMKFQ